MSKMLDISAVLLLSCDVGKPLNNCKLGAGWTPVSLNSLMFIMAADHLGGWAFVAAYMDPLNEVRATVDIGLGGCQNCQFLLFRSKHSTKLECLPVMSLHTAQSRWLLFNQMWRKYCTLNSKYQSSDDSQSLYITPNDSTRYDIVLSITSSQLLGGLYRGHKKFKGKCWKSCCISSKINLHQPWGL